MNRKSGIRSKFIGVLAAGVIASVAVYVILAGSVAVPELGVASRAALRSPSGSPQLVAISPLPAMDEEMCEWIPASAGVSLVAALQQSYA